VLLIRLGHADRRVERDARVGIVARLGPLDALLDFADVVEVLVEPRLVARSETGLEIAEIWVTESRMLASCLARATRCSWVPGRPNSRSNTTRGLISIGTGVVSDDQEMVFM
jgi:hypothetical protein